MHVIPIGTGPVVAPVATTYTHPATDTTERTIITITTVPATRPQFVSAEFAVGALTRTNARLREYRSPDNGATWDLSRSLTFNPAASTAQIFAMDLTGWQVKYTLQTGSEPSPTAIRYNVNFR